MALLLFLHPHTFALLSLSLRFNCLISPPSSHVRNVLFVFLSIVIMNLMVSNEAQNLIIKDKYRRRLRNVDGLWHTNCSRTTNDNFSLLSSSISLSIDFSFSCSDILYISLLFLLLFFLVKMFLYSVFFPYLSSIAIPPNKPTNNDDDVKTVNWWQSGLISTFAGKAKWDRNSMMSVKEKTQNDKWVTVNKLTMVNRQVVNCEFLAGKCSETALFLLFSLFVCVFLSFFLSFRCLFIPICIDSNCPDGEDNQLSDDNNRHKQNDVPSLMTPDWWRWFNSSTDWFRDYLLPFPHQTFKCVEESLPLWPCLVGFLIARISLFSTLFLIAVSHWMIFHFAVF